MTSIFAEVANADTDIQVAQNIGFAIIAALMVWGALRVVTTRNIVHAALWLVLVLAGAASLFILVGAEFVALTQVLVYIGAIVVLFLFGIMLTRAPIKGDLTGGGWLGAGVVGVAMCGLLVFALVDTFGGDRLPAETQITSRTAVVNEFEARTGISTSGQSEGQLVAQVEKLGLPKSKKATEVATARAIAQKRSSIDSNTTSVSDAIFSGYLLPFEVVSILLTAALIGAIVIARKE